MTTKSQLDELTKNLMVTMEPPDRRAVSEIVAELLYIADGHRWDPDRAPYMIRPLDETNSRHHNVVCFVGPARCGKTMALILGLYLYIVTRRPRDSLLVHSAQDLARDLSQRELSRMHKYSMALVDQLVPERGHQNIHDKRYRSGMQFNIAWPSNTQLASRTFYNTLLTDYDRWPGNVGGEGSGFMQALKRLQNAGSAGMAVVESSPGSEWLDPTWRRGQFVLGRPVSHVFPDTVSGIRANICSIYNDGTRELWYTPCSACGEYYPQWADISAFGWVEDPDPVRAAATAGARCCWCDAIHPESEKKEENKNGVWLAEGQTIDCNGKIKGESRLGQTFPSFSLGGGAACDQPRHELILKYLNASLKAEITGDDMDLKASVNQDIGAPMRPRLSGKQRDPHPLMARQEDLGKWVVPRGVRFLVAAVDIQKNRFVVQVHGYGVNDDGDRERWIIDRYNLSTSNRPDPNSDDKMYPVDPARYLEDWEVLTKLITKSYPLAYDENLRMSILSTWCDSGGLEGVTLRAYDYWRSLKNREGTNLQNKFELIKGDGRDTAKLIAETWPDTSGNKSRGASRGDAPVLRLNTNLVKDRIAFDLERDEPGPGYVHFPEWLKLWWFEELTREQRMAKGWSAEQKNEAWDLMVYAEAGAMWGPIRRMKRGPDGINSINWDKPPAWAREPHNNPYVFDPGDISPGKKSGGFDVSKWRV